MLKRGATNPDGGVRFHQAWRALEEMQLYRSLYENTYIPGTVLENIHQLHIALGFAE